ncbi:hypothetical protein ABFS82_02G126400 [Erythranthe guttata]
MHSNSNKIYTRKNSNISKLNYNLGPKLGFKSSIGFSSPIVHRLFIYADDRGKIEMDEEFRREIIRSHFSHPHPLKLIVYNQTLNILFPCAGCKLKPYGVLYSCLDCDYFLHQSCFEMRKKITHPLHKKHDLTLMINPAYRLVCDACGETGKGFSYHCKPCSFDLHILCAMLPLSVTHESHKMHKLNLTSESSYPVNKFSCDICLSVGSRQWLYRCKSCGFDAHLKCAAGDKFPSVRSASQSKEPTPPQAVPTCSIVAPSAPQLPPMQQQQQNIMPSDPPFEVNRRNNELARQAIQQTIINNSGALAQAILSGGFVGGYDGDNTGLHLVIEWISALNNSGNIIGGGGISAFDAFASGGGSSQDSLHAVTNGGGGGGGGGGARDVADSVQGVNDGGGGEEDYEELLFGDGNGIDFLGGLLGG